MSGNSKLNLRQTLAQLRIYPIAVLLGSSVGLIVCGFIWLVTHLKDLIWHQESWEYSNGVILGICVIGGLLVGLINQSTKSREATAHDLVEVLSEVDQIETKKLAGAGTIFRRAALGVSSLGFGGPLGPEAPIIEIVTNFSARISAFIRLTKSQAARISVAGALGGVFGGPIALATDEFVSARESSKVQRLVNLGPEILAGVSAFLVFRKLMPNDGLHVFHSSSQHSSDLNVANIWILLLVIVVVSAATLMVQQLIHRLRQIFATQLRGGPVVAGVLSGLILGLVVIQNPIVLFSGHHEIQQLLDGNYSSTDFLVAGLLKILVLAVCLAGGWFGGEIFPLAFIGSSIALALSALVSSNQPLTFAAVGFVTAVTVGIRKPLVSFILAILLFPEFTWLPMLLATGIAVAFIRRTSEAVVHADKSAN